MHSVPQHGAVQRPKPVRQYDALQLSLNRSFLQQLVRRRTNTLTVVWNYAGIASSDEIRPRLKAGIWLGSATAGEYSPRR